MLSHSFHTWTACLLCVFGRDSREAGAEQNSSGTANMGASERLKPQKNKGVRLMIMLNCFAASATQVRLWRNKWYPTNPLPHNSPPVILATPDNSSPRFYPPWQFPFQHLSIPNNSQGHKTSTWDMQIYVQHVTGKCGPAVSKHSISILHTWREII